MSRDDAAKFQLLTKREKLALKLVAEGLYTKQIAERMHIKVKTVDCYRQRIAWKTGFRGPVLQARFAIRVGLVEP